VISIYLKTTQEKHVVKGTVLRGQTQRLLHVDGIEVEAPLESHLVYMRNSDVPGVIGRVGTILGQHQINIANFSLGRRGEEELAGQPREAIAVVQVDVAVSETVLGELRKSPAVKQAKAIRLF
jgi:D-3-phosphoglycerate dehydrogenase